MLKKHSVMVVTQFRPQGTIKQQHLRIVVSLRDFQIFAGIESVRSVKARYEGGVAC